MKDDTLILLAALGVGGYLVYKKTTDTAAAFGGAIGGIPQGIFDAGAAAVAGAQKGVEDTIVGIGKGTQEVINTIGNLPQALTPPVPEYIQKEMKIAQANKGLVTQVQPKIAVIDSQAPKWKNDLAINLQTQKFGYIPTTGFDSGLLIPDILHRTPAVYTGGGIAPKVVDIRKTYEFAGVPYATFAQQTGQTLTPQANAFYSIVNNPVQSFSQPPPPPAKTDAPSKPASTASGSSVVSASSGVLYQGTNKLGQQVITANKSDLNLNYGYTTRKAVKK